MSTYAEKLKHPLWQKKRLKILERDGFKCQLCSDEETELQVHHLKYTGEPWEAPDKDLQTLCKHCHSIVTRYEIEFIEGEKIYTNGLIAIVIKEANEMVSIFTISEDILECAATFTKNSKVLDVVFKYSNHV